MLKKKNILGIEFTSEKSDIILEYVKDNLQKNDKKLFIVTPNPEITVMARKDLSYQNILNNAEIALPDGVGVLFAGWVLGKPISHRISGIDFMEMLCKELSKQPITVGFLGGRGTVAEKTAECLVQKYPGLRVSFTGEDAPPDLNDVKCDMLFVAFGSPKQEEWISENLQKLPVKAAMGVGGAFDMISGKVPRAPRFIRSFGLEWLYRLIRQPWRLKRQLSLLVFVFLILRERIKSSVNRG